MAVDLGLAEVVEVRGVVDDVSAVLGLGHVGVNASRSEAFGRVTAEYMRAGLAVCASRAGATPELVEHGRTGLLFPLEDWRSLARDLELLAADDQLRQTLAAAGQRSVRRLTSERHATELVGILRGAINESAGELG